jgi:methenyltetrahydrofolate cyclohydrolase
LRVRQRTAIIAANPIQQTAGHRCRLSDGRTVTTKSAEGAHQISVWFPALFVLAADEPAPSTGRCGMDAQQDTPQLINLTLTEFADALGSDQTAPGGGSAAALAGALGGALAVMVARLTLGRAKYAAHQDEMAAVEAKADALKTTLLALVDADTAAYDQVTDAYKLPKDTDAQKARRTGAVQAAFRAATEAPLATAEACAEVLDLAGQVAAHGNRNAASDAAVAALLAHAGLRGAVRNVRINLGSLQDAAFRAHAEDRVTLLLKAGESALERALTAADA